MGRKLFNFKNIAMVAVFSLIAFVGFNVVSAANNKSQTEVVDTEFTFTDGNVTNSANYTTTPPVQCIGEETVCVIKAPDSSGRPQMSAIVPGTSPSQTVQQRILAALNAPGGPTLNETVLSLKAE